MSQPPKPAPTSTPPAPIPFSTRLKLLGVYWRNRCKKLPFYARHLAHQIRPRTYHPPPQTRQDAYIKTRVNYYNQITRAFKVQSPLFIQQQLAGKHSAYVVDIAFALRGFQKLSAIKLDTRFGDSLETPTGPTILKCRYIKAGHANQNSVLLKLNSVRHFNFIRDPLQFTQKKNIAVWRGNCKPNNAARTNLVRAFHDHPLCDIGAFTRSKTIRAQSDVAHKPYLPLSAQLRYKFILSLEGNDAATNTKWIMSSNSLLFMRKPRVETWFMEGKLRAGIHYVRLKDDFSDLPQKIAYYAAPQNHAKALAIIQNAHRFVAQFQDPAREQLITHLVLEKYLHYARHD